MKHTLTALLFLLPITTSAQGLQQYIPTFVSFISDTLIPFILGIAFLVVVFNIIRYFVFQSSSPEGREKAKGYIVYSILAFVVIIVFWGIVSLLVGTSGLNGANTPTPDFETQFGTGGGTPTP